MSSNDPRAEALALAALARRAGVTQINISEALGVSQSQISRILSGNIKRRSKLFLDIRGFLHQRSDGVSPETVIQNAELVNALAAVWDGTARDSAALASVIRSLGALRGSATTNRGNSPGSADS